MTEKIGKIRIAHANDARVWNQVATNAWKGCWDVHYTKYQIKETDMRVKTATFTSPDYVDLTRGLNYVLISSKYHENFSGVILDVDYDPSTRLYSYQCQDWSRLYIGTPEMSHDGTVSTIYDLLTSLLTHFEIDNTKTGKKKYSNYTAKDKKPFKKVLSGLRPLWQYDQSSYKGNKYKGNPFKQKPKFIARGKTFIEIIRDMVFSQNGYFDVWFNDKAILQIEPLSKTDWEKTGLHLAHSSVLKEKYKFSTTNAITRVRINGTGTSLGEAFDSNDLLSGNLDLSAFFGRVGVSISDPTQKDKNTSNATKKTTNTTPTPTADYKNTKIWIGADGGSGDFCQEIIKELEKNGWSCHYSGEGANVHYTDYSAVTDDYAVLAIVDNGFCCTTIKEAYVNFCKSGTPYLKRNGVRVMFMFDTRSWVDGGSRGMGPFRYGDFNYHVFSTAHDDPTGYCTSMNSTQFFKDWGATYCAHPTAKGIVNQFLAGGICK